MKKLSKILMVSVGIIYFLGGCSWISEPRKSTPVFVVWKSPGMKFADQGFLIDDKQRTKLEVYASAQPVADLSITKDMVCSGMMCMDKKEFNKKYLSSSYPDTILEDILHGREIFGGKNLKKEKDGFSQKIKSNKVDIEYLVNGNEIGFVDKKNGITIVIKKGSK